LEYFSGSQTAFYETTLGLDQLLELQAGFRQLEQLLPEEGYWKIISQLLSDFNQKLYFGCSLQKDSRKL
jgi:hypothetical protein